MTNTSYNSNRFIGYKLAFELILYSLYRYINSDPKSSISGVTISKIYDG